MPAPIALFVYNRPRHTRDTVAALQCNHDALDSDLYVFSDGAKGAEDMPRVEEVRRYVRKISGFKSVTVIESTTNSGLANSIISGVTRLCRDHGRVIVLEDDLITSPHFLTFMNNALNRYEGESRVMHIAGYMFPIDPIGLPQTLFLRTSSCWGWATWKRAWDRFEKNPQNLLERFDSDMRQAFNFDNSYDHWNQVLQNVAGKIDTWAVFWYASVFLNGGLCLHPAVSLVQNIGLDGSGVHCGSDQAYEGTLGNILITQFEPIISENERALDRVKTFYRSQQRPIYKKLFNKIKRFFVGS
jgi:hypothetical protein